MRVVHAVWSLADRTGGLARAVVLIANAQAREGLDVTVLTTVGAGESPGAPVHGLHEDVAVHRFARSAFAARFAGSSTLRRWLRANLQPEDVVHVHAIWDLTAVTAGREARRRGCRLVVTPHGSLEPFDLRKHALAKRLLGPLVVAPLLDRSTVHCTTDREADCLVTYGAHPLVCTAPLPLEPVRVEGAHAGRIGLRRRLGLADDAAVLLFMGRINYKKGLGHLIEALRHMTVPAQLLVAGTGAPDYEAALREQAAALGLGARVTWLGWVGPDQKSELFRAADVFVLLSDAENYGISVVEALQHGAVTVTSAEVGAAVDLARSGAVLIASREPRAAAARLDEALLDEGLRRRTVQAAAEALATTLSPETVERRYLDLALATASRSA